LHHALLLERTHASGLRGQCDTLIKHFAAHQRLQTLPERGQLQTKRIQFFPRVGFNAIAGLGLDFELVFPSRRDLPLELKLVNHLRLRNRIFSARGLPAIFRREKSSHQCRPQCRHNAETKPSRIIAKHQNNSRRHGEERTDDKPRPA
jgi:hypothetical protein